MSGRGFPVAPTVIAFILLLLFYHANFHVPYPRPVNRGRLVFGTNSRHSLHGNISYTKTLVVPKTISDNTTWLSLLPSDINVALYSVDGGPAPFHSPANKGHEAMVYLTYLIDFYDSLSSITFFTHAHSHAWHNAAPLSLSMPAMLAHLRPVHVFSTGYFNLRCAWEPGCPTHLFPRNSSTPLGAQEQGLLADAWPELFPNDPLPEAVAQACCAQFAVSREHVHNIPRDRLVRWRDWLLRTELTDHWSGRVWEFLWAYVFTGDAVHCPKEKTCWCEGYGICFGDDEWETWTKKGREREDWRRMLGASRDKENSRVETEHNHNAGEPKRKVGVLEGKVAALDEEMESLTQMALLRGKEMGM